MRRSSTSVCRRDRDRHVLIAASVLAILLIVGVFAASCGGTTSATSSSPTTVGSSSTTSVPGTSSTISTPETTTGEAGVVQVAMKNAAFDPDSVTIKVGESVTWTNEDAVTHTIVADNGEFESGDLAQGATFTFKFDNAGTYPYHCSIHPTMTGTVVVE